MSTNALTQEQQSIVQVDRDIENGLADITGLMNMTQRKIDVLREWIHREAPPSANTLGRFSDTEADLHNVYSSMDKTLKYMALITKNLQD